MIRAGGGGGGNGVATMYARARVRLVGVQTIPINVLTAIAFDTEAEDTGNIWSAGAPTLFLAPSWATICRVTGNIGILQTSAAPISIRYTAHKNNASWAETPSVHIMSNNDATDPASHVGLISGMFSVVGGVDNISYKFRHVDTAPIDLGGGGACWACVEFFNR